MSTLSLWLFPAEVSPLTLFTLFFIFSTIILLGLLLNVFVIYRMLRLAKHDRYQFLSGTGVFLCVMASTDIVSLLSIYSQFIGSISRTQIHPLVLTALCKGTEFVSRVAYTQSMYCWLCMSGLRYMAALHPLAYSTVWRNPLLALSSVAVVSIILNLHIFASIAGNRDDACLLTLDLMSSVYNVADILLSFAIPFGLILYMDLSVLCGRTIRRTSDPLLHVVFHRVDEESEKQRMSNMRRFMTITLISLALSFPENILRAVRILLPSMVDSEVSPLIFHIVKTLYFAKFSFNAFYLTAYVFDRNVLSKTSSSRQLSVSIRRLEENPSICPRERSNTVSYRATTPVPQLTRNSSCFILDQAEEPPKEWV